MTTFLRGRPAPRSPCSSFFDPSQFPRCGLTDHCGKAHRRLDTGSLLGAVSRVARINRRPLGTILEMRAAFEIGNRVCLFAAAPRTHPLIFQDGDAEFELLKTIECRNAYATQLSLFSCSFL